MGWTYVVNDEKISAIGQYIRSALETRVAKLTGGAADDQPMFGWEIAHRTDSRRVSRKYLQLLVDLLTFVFSGWVALLLFWVPPSSPSSLAIMLSVIELVLLTGLGIKIINYADLTKGK